MSWEKQHTRPLPWSPQHLTVGHSDHNQTLHRCLSAIASHVTAARHPRLINSNSNGVSRRSISALSTSMTFRFFYANVISKLNQVLSLICTRLALDLRLNFSCTLISLHEPPDSRPSRTRPLSRLRFTPCPLLRTLRINTSVSRL